MRKNYVRCHFVLFFLGENAVLAFEKNPDKAAFAADEVGLDFVEMRL